MKLLPNRISTSCDNMLLVSCFGAVLQFACATALSSPSSSVILFGSRSAEAGTAVLTYGRTVLGLKRITGLVNAANTPSIRVLDKLGFVREGDIQFTPGGPVSELYVAQDPAAAAASEAAELV